MPALPPITDLIDSATSEAQAKTWFLNLRQFVADLLGTTGTQAAALAAIGSPFGGYADKSSAYTVGTTDRGKIINCTAALTLTLPSIASAGQGFSVAVLNSSAGSVDVLPHSGDTINGDTTRELGPGDSVLFVVMGSAWRIIGGGTFWFRQRELITGTYVVPSDVRAIYVQAVGAVAARGDHIYTTTQGWGGSGGAGYAEKWISPRASQYEVVLGATTSDAGTAGTTTFDTIYITGSSGTKTETGAAGGVASGGDFNANGGVGGNGSVGGGGGGGAGSRGGNGYSGGKGYTTADYTFGNGGGGGTGGIGGDGTASANGAGGAAATVASASALANKYTSIVNTAEKFSAGTSVESTVAAGRGAAAMTGLTGAPGGGRGSANASGGGSAGRVFVTEFIW